MRARSKLNSKESKIFEKYRELKESIRMMNSQRSDSDRN